LRFIFSFGVVEQQTQEDNKREMNGFTTKMFIIIIKCALLSAIISFFFL